MAQGERFCRSLPVGLVSELNRLEEKPDSWWHKLVNREKHDVFFAVRGGYLSIYTNGGSFMKIRHAGGRLHLEVHEEYLIRRSRNPYVDLNSSGGHSLVVIDSPDDLIGHFDSVQNRIKVFRGDERRGVSVIASQSDCVIDIEVTGHQTEGDPLLSEGGEGTRGSIDFAAVSPEGQLCLFEAKLLANPELRSSDGAPRVIRQLDHYQQWADNPERGILDGFRHVRELFGQLHGSFFRKRSQAVPNIVGIQAQPILVIFGFNDVQCRHELPDVLDGLDDNGLDESRIISIGNPKGLKSRSLFRKSPGHSESTIEESGRDQSQPQCDGITRLREIARKRDCLELFDEARQMLGSLFVWRNGSSMSTMPFARKKADLTLFCLYPEWSSREKGLAVGVWPKRLQDLGIAEESALARCVAGLHPEPNPNWPTCSVLVRFDTADSLRRFVAILNV